MGVITTGFTAGSAGADVVKTGSSAGYHTIVTDASTSTYLAISPVVVPPSGGVLLQVGLPNVSGLVPGNPTPLHDGTVRISLARAVATQVRAASGSAYGGWYFARGGQPIKNVGGFQVPASFVSRAMTWQPGPTNGESWTQMLVAGGGIQLRVPAISGVLRLAELEFQWWWEQRAEVDATGPTGTVGTSTPTVVADWDDPEPLGPEPAWPVAAQVWFYHPDVYNAPGFDPLGSSHLAERALTDLNGPFEYDPNGLEITVNTARYRMEGLPNGTWRAYMRAAKNHDGSRWWSLFSHTEFTVAAPPPPDPTITATANNATQAVDLTLVTPVNSLHPELSEGMGHASDWFDFNSGTSSTFASDVLHDWNGTGSSVVIRRGGGSGDMWMAADGDKLPWMPVEPGDVVAAGFGVRLNNTGSLRDVRARIQLFDANKDPLTYIDGTVDTEVADDWLWVPVTGVVPANGAYARLVSEVFAVDGAEDHALAGFTLYRHTNHTDYSVGAGLHLPEPDAGYPNPYLTIDRAVGGDTIPEDAWTRIANLPIDPENPTVEYTDFLAPRGVEVHYRAATVIDNYAAYSAPDAINIAIPSATTETPVTDDTEITPDGRWWLKAVTNPNLNTPIAAVEGTVTEAPQNSSGVFYIPGRKLAIVVDSPVVHGRDGALQIIADTAEDRDAVQAILTHPGTMLLQDRESPDRYIRIPGPRPVAKSNPDDYRIHTWDIQYVEVDPPPVT